MTDATWCRDRPPVAWWNVRHHITAVVLGAAASLLVAACGDDGDDAGSVPTHPDADASLGAADEATTGYVREPAPQVGEYALPDLTAGGEDFEFSAEPGGMLLVFFGYTNCPDVCPNTMTNLSRVEDALAERDGADGSGFTADDVEVAMVTIDPERDIDTLPDYVQAFVADGHALGTDDAAELQRVADAFGVAYQVIEGENGTEVGHVDVLFGIDDTGSMVMNWPFGVTPDQIVADLDYLAAETA